MKIALSFFGCHTRGGVERLVLETANFLAGRHEVHVLAHDFDSNLLDAHVIRHSVPIMAKPTFLQMASYARRCPSILRDIGAEASGTFGVICPAGGILNVQSVHAAWLDASQRIRNLPGRLRQACNPIHPFLLTLERRHFAGRQFRKLTAPTEQVRADLMRFYGVHETDVAIIPNGFCEKAFNTARSESLRPVFRKRLGFSEDDFVVAFVGNELERKGFSPLLKALALLNNKRVHLLAVVGRVSIRPYRAEALALGLGRRVHFTGAKDDLAPYYAAADVLALPTQYEAWGLVIVEALASGTPVLASRLAGAAVTVREGATGELLDNPLDIGEIAAKLEVLAAAAGERDRRAVAGSVAHLTWKRVLKQYENVLRSAS